MSKKQSKSSIDKATERIKVDNERGARQSVIEDLFVDFNRSRVQVYWMNFFRGIFFGMGSVVGGAGIIAVSAVVLGMFVDLPGGIGDFVQRILEAMNKSR
jgi:hypothetical protein